MFYVKRVNENIECVVLDYVSLLRQGERKDFKMVFFRDLVEDFVLGILFE